MNRREFEKRNGIMKTRNLIILFAVVVAVAAYIFLFERHRPTTDEAKAEAEKVLKDFDSEQVREIIVESESSSVRLEKSGDAWRLREPMDYPASESAISTALGSLGGLEAERRLPLADMDPAEYGLDPPAASIRLLFEDGSERLLSVGGELPLGSNRAVLVDGEDEVAVTSGWFVSDLQREVDDWRSRDVVDVMADDVASIDIRTDEDVIRVVRDEDRWQLLDPLEDVADADHVTSLVSDLNSLQIDEFIDEPGDLDEIGMVTPEYELTVVRSDGAAPLRLLLGATREVDGATRVACRRGEDDYFWVADGVRKRLSKAPVLWRSKKVAPFDTWDAASLEISSGGDSVSLGYDDLVWTFDDGIEADMTAVQDRLRGLADLEAADYDLMQPLTGEMGTATIGFKGDEDEGVAETLSFMFFSPLSEGGKAMVQVSNRATLMGVDAAAVESIIGDLDTLRPPPVAEELETD
jgi:hypothetical protein